MRARVLGARRSDLNLNSTATSIDPDITLPSPGMNVEISHYYNSSPLSGAPYVNGPYGYNRTISPAQVAQLYNSGQNLIIQRGNGAIATFLNNGSGTFLPGTPGVLNTVVEDNVDDLLLETTPEGITTAYPLDTTGYPTTVTYVQDAVGNRHTFGYSSGLLQTIEDAVGRLVTLGYSGGLLQSIEDWAGRFTTFAYDTHSAAPKNLLTTITGPTGCQTVYEYGQVGSGTNADWTVTGIIDPERICYHVTLLIRCRRVLSRECGGSGHEQLHLSQRHHRRSPMRWGTPPLPPTTTVGRS